MLCVFLFVHNELNGEALKYTCPYKNSGYIRAGSKIKSRNRYIVRVSRAQTVIGLPRAFYRKKHTPLYRRDDRSAAHILFNTAEREETKKKKYFGGRGEEKTYIIQRGKRKREREATSFAWFGESVAKFRAYLD